MRRKAVAVIRHSRGGCGVSWTAGNRQAVEVGTTAGFTGLRLALPSAFSLSA
jgi:hypothetical protein